MTTRRQYLSRVGAVSAGLLTAGCVGEGTTPSDQSTRTTVSNTTSNATTTNSTTEQTTEEPPEQSLDGTRYLLGNTTVLDDFEDLSSWSVSNGAKEPDTENAFAGSQAMRLTAPKQNQFVWATKSVDWDLSESTLSLAVNVDKPIENLIVAVRLIAPDTNNVLKMGELIRSRKAQGWIRLDMATRDFEGNPDLSSVSEVQLGMRAADGAIDFSVDDLRSVPRPEKGKVVLSFDDSLQSHYTQAFQTMQEYGMPGNVGVITGQVGTEGSLSVDQMSEMQSAGWEFASHSTSDTSLNKLSTQEMWVAVNDANDWLANNGFTKGGESFVYPHGVYNDEILGFVRENHTMGFRYLGPLGAGSGQITDPLTISRGNAAYDQSLNKMMVNYAEMFNNLTVFTFHGLTDGEGLSMTPEAFRDLIDYIDHRDVEVTTFSKIKQNLLAE